MLVYLQVLYLKKNIKDIENFKLKDSEYIYLTQISNSISNVYTYGITKQEYDDGIKDFSNNCRYLIKNDLLICAPFKDMNTENMRLSDDYKLEKHIPDPVVLKEVPGGYLIITAWGDESEDPLVKN